MPGSTLLLAAAPGIPLYGPSGASAHLRGLAGALRPAAVVCALDVDRRGRHGTVDVPVVATGVPGWPSWLRSWREYREVWAARRVARAALRFHPGLVWERHALYSDAGWKVHDATGCDWLLEVNAPLAEERLRYEVLPHPAWARAWERDVLLAAPCIAAVSRWLCRWLVDLGCRNVVHLPNGVEPHVGDRVATRRELGLGDELVVGFVGSMKPWHGAHRIPAILDRIPGAVGLVVGGGGDLPSHPRLRRTGHVEEARVAHLVAAMDVALAPYGLDAPPWFNPLKILAYRAQGTPVVAADVGDCAELVGDAGTVLPPDADEDAWAAAVVAWAAAGTASERRRPPSHVRGWDSVVAEGLAAVRGAGVGSRGIASGGGPHPS